MGERGLAWPLFVGALAVAGCGGESWCGDWVEWGADASHNGTTCKRSEIPKRFIADTVFDPFVAQEIAEAKGQLPIRYQTPLVVGGDDLYMGVKSGTYVSCDPPGSGMPAGCGPPGTWASEVWGEAYWDFHEDGTITPEWTFVSDWKPEPVQGSEPLFHAAANSYDYILYVPGAGGTLHKLHRHTGVEMGRLNPFGDSIDADAYVAGPVSIDAQGNVYYNVLRYQGDPLSADAGGWLVKIDPQDRFTMVSFADLVAGAPAAHAACTIGYPTARYSPPYPPLAADGSVVPPETAPCGSQRPALNVAPAVASDGTIYIVSRAHFNSRYSYLVAVAADLTPKWATSLRDLVDDGCGVLVPDDGDAAEHAHDCTPGSPMGIDPSSGEPPAMQALDSSTASPVVLPDGAILYGAWSGYNDGRGHLLKFAPDGRFVTAFDFGWDVTPAVDRHGGSYSVVLEDNHYGAGPYSLTRLDSDLAPEWSYRSDVTQSCARQADGTVTCVDDHPGGFEWCTSAPAIDHEGTVYATSEDGNLYAIDRDGHERGRFFLHVALSAAAAPLSLDWRGHIVALNGGHLSVVGP